MTPQHNSAEMARKGASMPKQREPHRPGAAMPVAGAHGVETQKASAIKATRPKASKTIGITAMNLQTFILHVVGTTPLITHKWSEKAKQQIRDKKSGKPQKAHAICDPGQETIDAAYWLGNPPKTWEAYLDDPYKYPVGFPACAFKACAVSAASTLKGVTKVFLRQAFRIVGEFVTINGVARMREDAVMVGGMSKSADLRYRPCWDEWSADLHIQFDADTITPDQISNLVMRGGFGVGVGEWRQEKDGVYGSFAIGRAE